MPPKETASAAEKGLPREKKVMDPAARRSNDINQVCRTGTKGCSMRAPVSIYQPVK